MRHLIILDFRAVEEYDKKHIRKAIKVDLENYKQTIAALMVSLSEKTKAVSSSQDKTPSSKEAIKGATSTDLDGTRYKSQYPNDDLKRVLMVFPDNSEESKELETHISKEVAALSDQIL